MKHTHNNLTEELEILETSKLHYQQVVIDHLWEYHGYDADHLQDLVGVHNLMHDLGRFGETEAAEYDTTDGLKGRKRL